MCTAGSLARRVHAAGEGCVVISIGGGESGFSDGGSAVWLTGWYTGYSVGCSLGIDGDSLS